MSQSDLYAQSDEVSEPVDVTEPVKTDENTYVKTLTVRDADLSDSPDRIIDPILDTDERVVKASFYFYNKSGSQVSITLEKEIGGNKYPLKDKDGNDLQYTVADQDGVDVLIDHVQHDDLYITSSDSGSYDYDVLANIMKNKTQT